MTTIHTIAIDILNLLGGTDPELENACDTLCNSIAEAPELIDHIGMGRALMRAARAIDPSESSHAAHIRDAIRDNTDLDIDSY